MPKRTDRHQAEITAALRRIPGVTVTPTHVVGAGFPDLAVGFRGVSFLLELKDGNLPPSRKRLTPDEAAWHQSWTGHSAVCETLDDVLKVIGLK